MEKLREEFAKKGHRKATTLRDIREIVEAKLAEMLAQNPTRTDYQRKYEEIVADYNREKDRATAEETFRRLADLAGPVETEGAVRYFGGAGFVPGGNAGRVPRVVNPPKDDGWKRKSR